MLRLRLLRWTGFERLPGRKKTEGRKKKGNGIERATITQEELSMIE